ncbi:MAG TPA: DUF222 domain-containing protein [Naasia sp.]|jgi:hypothetical protein
MHEDELVDPHPPRDPEAELADMLDSAAQWVARQRMTVGELDQENEWEYLGLDRATRIANRLLARRKAAIGAAADQYELIDQLRLEAEQETGATWAEPDALAWREFRAEIAAMLQAHEKTAQATIEQARMLVHFFPTTLDGLRRADFPERHARILVDEAAGLPEELLSEYEERLLPHAPVLVPSRFERLARKIAASLEPRNITERHQDAVTARRVVLTPAPDGMAWIAALLSAEDALGASAAITGLARGLKVEGEERTQAQLEADVIRDLLVDAHGVTAPPVDGEEPRPTPAARRGVQAEIYCHVPAFTAIGKSMQPGCLEGYGPIDPETARRISGNATSWIRLLTNPETGAVLSFGRDKYKVPADLRRLVQVRDEVCRFVGCTRSARLCDLDHTQAWKEDGETVLANLAAFCRGHHRLKHSTRWRAGQSPGGDGVLTWTSPHGVVYTAPTVPPLPPPRRRRVGATPHPMTAWLDDTAPPF